MTTGAASGARDPAPAIAEGVQGSGATSAPPPVPVSPATPIKLAATIKPVTYTWPALPRTRAGRNHDEHRNQ